MGARSTLFPRAAIWAGSLPLAALLLAASCMKAPTPPTSGGAGGAPAVAPPPVLIFTPPASWEVQPPSMAIFLGMWKLPNGGIANVSYMRGQTSIDSITQNVERWLNQFEVPGSTPQQSYRMESVESYYKEQRLSLIGTLASTNQIGGGDPRPDWMLVGAVLTTPAGPVYVKILGPRADLEPELDSIWSLIGTMRIE